MMHGGPSGFHNAPVTRALVISSAIITVTYGLRGRSRSIGLSYQDITQNHGLWKTVPSIFAFSSSPELIIGFAYLLFLADSQVLASGPYGLIFAAFVPFYFDIPVTSRFRMLGLNFSNKSAIYFAGFQLVLSAWRRSFIPAICGLLTGFLFRANIFCIRKLKRNYRSVGNFMPEPPESSITTLVSMGFETNAARQALIQARNDINVATNILLEAQSR
ncbi:hypothetical protein ZIOFF_053634 [Zingiber officinale]|uniref:UBA domain-containing protein n=1 Tax=Zingiber officinale TaxID=94328 RepID=A0A8J5KQ66_ZINOF|nr:hypothetical protein ZIOFF_053634 [Zingiber officinale]